MATNPDLLSRLQSVFPNAFAAGDITPENSAFDLSESGMASLERARTLRSGAASALGASLDSWTLKPCTRGYVELTVTDFGDGYSEATAVVRPPDFRPPRPGVKRTKNGDQSRECMSESDRLRSAQRAKKNVRHKVKQLGADRILTLTSREYMQTPDDLWRCLSTFSKLMRREVGDRWAYVAVPEIHKSGKHWHVHLAISGHLNVNMCRRLWHVALRRNFAEAVYDVSPGNPDIVYKKHTYAARLNAISRYISKYITKAAEDGFMHRKRYESTRNIPPPVRHKWYLDLNALNDLVLIRKIQEVSNGALSRNPTWEVYGGSDCFVAETEPRPT